MALIVETGAGIANAECYADVAACTAYATAFYGASLNGSPADKEAAIRRATAYLNGLFQQCLARYRLATASPFPQVADS